MFPIFSAVTCAFDYWTVCVCLQTDATEMLHTTGSRASAVLLMFPMPSMRLLERQRATAWGLQKSPLSVLELQRLVEDGFRKQEEEVMARLLLLVFASPLDWLTTRWPGKHSLLAQRCSSKHLQISCLLDQEKGCILFELTILHTFVINILVVLVRKHNGHPACKCELQNHQKMHPVKLHAVIVIFFV